MYDAKGRDLAVGDFVLVPAVVTQLFADEDGCFVGLETSFGDSNDNTVTMWPVDSAVVLRADECDENDFKEFFDDEVTAGESEVATVH